MRIQVYPENNLVFVGTEVREANLSNVPSRDFAEFEHHNEEHPYHKYIAYLIPKNVPPTFDPEAMPMRDASRMRMQGHCWAQTDIVEGHRNNTFHFDNVGDVLPWHTHAEDTVHTSEVLEGSFDLETAEGHRTIKKGDPVIDWEPGEWHGFKALEAGSLLLNRVKRPA